MRRAALLVVLAVGGCATPASPGHEPTFGCTASKVLFPVNVAPDIAVNTFLAATYPVTVLPYRPTEVDDAGRQRGSSGLFMINVFFCWIIGPVCGVIDAWNGYPLWDPLIVDEHRRSRVCVDGVWTDPGPPRKASVEPDVGGR